MLDNLTSAIGPAATATQSFGSLTVRERVIDTGGRAIAIAEIGTVSIYVHRRWPLRLLVAALGYGVVSTVLGYAITSYQHAWVKWLAGLAAGALLAFLIRSIYRLEIATSDGSRTVFDSKNLPLLLEVKTFITDKINSDDLKTAKTFIIDQSKHEHRIDKYVAGDDNSVTAEAVVQGSGNVVATGQGTRAGTTETTYHAQHSPGAQLGTGNVATGNTQTVTTIDYGAHLRTIEDWRQFYGQSAETRGIEQRLAELEKLMRSGTPSPDSRSRLRQIASDLSEILQSYPAMVQVFRDILRLAGF
ncbi:MAG: DUF6232 family protein [Hyphomicrobiaceae bacterium]